MMKHYITEIHIEKLRNLSNIVIQLNPEEKQHLIITGKNGSGKTTLLLAIEEYLAINSNLALSKYSKGIELKFKDSVREYQEAEGEEKEDLLFLIKKELKSSSAFTAFKRWLIRDNGEYYPELAVLLNHN